MNGSGSSSISKSESRALERIGSGLLVDPATESQCIVSYWNNIYPSEAGCRSAILNSITAETGFLILSSALFVF